MLRPAQTIDSIAAEILLNTLHKIVPHVAQWLFLAIHCHLVGQTPFAAVTLAAEIFFTKLMQWQ